MEYPIRGRVWSPEETFKFIDMYRNLPTIWNPKDKLHKDKAALSDCWESISEEMGISIIELKKKKESLMTAFRANLKRKKQSMESGVGEDQIFKPSWMYYEPMEIFLGDIYDCKSVSYPEEGANITIDGTGQENQEILENEKNVDCKPKEIRRLKKPIKKRTIHNIIVTPLQNPIRTAVDELKQLNNSLEKSVSPPQEDECDLIGKYVAFQLRQLPLPDMMDAKDRIQEILSAYRKKNYDMTTSVCSPPESSQPSFMQTSTPQPQYSEYSSTNSDQNTSSPAIEQAFVNLISKTCNFVMNKYSDEQKEPFQ